MSQCTKLRYGRGGMKETRIWEESVIIPTYETGAPDRNPMFLEKRVYQGSSGKIYPYPSTQEISNVKRNVPWKAVWLENEYLKVMVLPELGGRIQRAYDKTNGYDFVYYNHVIKPALVGLLGPWISGGIEFNWPQHHRPTTFMPVQYLLRENEDGSVSVLLGDTDQMYGTKVITTITLYPGKAYIEIRGQLYNRTSLPQTFLWWANPAVAVNDDTQSVFPPDVHNVYDHGKRAVSRFPIATGEYYKHDYSEGVDISRYKNIPVPTSYMAERSKYDFVGGYDYREEAGLLHVADHHLSPGKKQWTWGCGDFGKAWDRNLTDEDGPYIELMTGMYCENQPDFSWLMPHEEKTLCQYFMPYKKVGQVKNASIRAVLNTEDREDGLYVCVYGTQKYEHAEIVISDCGKTVFREGCVLSPVDIYEKVIPVTVSDFYQCRVSVLSDGEELVAYQAEDQGIPQLADPAAAPAAPEHMMTNEELFLTGQHLEQYRHAVWLPDDYYLEGLKRDPEDVRINNAYGLLLLRRGAFAKAEPFFRTAIRRLTGNGMFNNPYDSETFYHLGLSLMRQEKYEEAFDAFYKAVWSKNQQEMSFYYLAAIEVRRRRLTSALALLEKGLVKNAHNIKALGLKAAVLRMLGRQEEANAQIERNLNLDPFDYVSRFVRAQISCSQESDLDEIKRLCGNSHETFLAAARDFMESGLYEDALFALRTFSGAHPMVEYYKGFCFSRLSDDLQASRSWKAAEAADSTCCFPNKPEDIAVLEEAMRLNPDGAKAPYYLGCLFYDKRQFVEATALWEKSRDLDSSFPTVHRNLSIAYYNKCGNKEQAFEEMETAFRLDESDARVLLEFDQLMRSVKKTPDERLALLSAHKELVLTRDDLYTEYITVLNLCGKYREAYDAISSHTFRTWEGAEGKITTQFKTSLLQMARICLRSGKADAAEAYLLEALSYPENLGEGRLEGTKDNHLYYMLGLAAEQLGKTEEAKSCFEKATLGAMEVAGMMYYYDQPADMILYQGMAKEKQGKQAEANARFYRLIDYGEYHVRDIFKMDYFAVSMPDMSVFDADMTEKNRAHCFYLMGLGKLGLGRKKEAAEDFGRVLEMDPNHQNAAIYRECCTTDDVM